MMLTHYIILLSSINTLLSQIFASGWLLHASSRWWLLCPLQPLCLQPPPTSTSLSSRRRGKSSLGRCSVAFVIMVDCCVCDRDPWPSWWLIVVFATLHLLVGTADGLRDGWLLCFATIVPSLCRAPPLARRDSRCPSWWLIVVFCDDRRDGWLLCFATIVPSPRRAPPLARRDSRLAPAVVR